MNLLLADIIAHSHSELLVQPHSNQTRAVALAWDSRLVQPGSLFVAVKGANSNGNDFIPEALLNGAVAVIASDQPSKAALAAAKSRGAALLRARNNDIFAALKHLAAAYRCQLAATVIGVTGSSGKTTTKDLIAAVLAAGFATHATPGNRNNEIGLPATLLDASPEHEMIVLEMGMQALGEIDALCEAARPSIGVLTNIGVAHCELLGSRDNIARAKAELFENLPDNTGIALLNGDDSSADRLVQLARLEERGITTLRYGLGEPNDLRATDISYDSLGRPSFDLWLPDGRRHRASVALPGEHNIYNALAAVGVGLGTGVPLPAILAALTQVKPAALRQELIELADGTLLINDTYNANPDSMRAALTLLSRLAARGKRIAVLGDMYELGSEEQRFHRETGAFAFLSGVDILMSVGRLGADISTGALEVGMPSDAVFACADIDAAATRLAAVLTGQEHAPVVLVKASRGMRLEELVARLGDAGSEKRR
ncbi:MAG: UDP-N-acetylmuramoyl-tripeptide--D-alanyl-D-alanine ligase [Coriobacteriales bacterium]|jgi:UDP-N-acetylmuramoyl-tripeptide--D-alanyl-D-alanine ligase|nr:UDP-N-acetylmuramoyl-tripeptide--D-alanyl-D-alanine ligase [Coriobacteriales bacterium]